MNLQQFINTQLVRYMDLKPGVSAFIDARTPGSHLKDNFCIIGAGVAESTKQPVHIKETSGFNIGGAGQPPGIKNSLHSHRSAELFIVFRGEFRIYWGNEGQFETVLRKGDVISVPTNVFRGFEVVGRDYGFMFSVLGGDDSGGGVIWHPEVIKASQGHGLYLRTDGTLADTHAGDAVPTADQLMPLLSEEKLKSFDNQSLEEMAKQVACFDEYRPSSQDFEDIDYKQYALTGSPFARYDYQVKSRDEVSIQAYSLKNEVALPWHQRKEKQVLINFSGDTQVCLQQQNQQASVILTPGDVLNIPMDTAIRLQNKRGESLIYSILGSDQPDPVELTL